MGDPRYRLPLQSSYSFSGTTPSEPIARPLKRRLTGPILDPFAFSHAVSTSQVQARLFDNVNSFESERRNEVSAHIGNHAMRHNPLAVAHLPSLDPTPEDPGAVFIHPPFNDFPDAPKYKDGLNYNLMAANPEWFLDPTDYISTVQSTVDAIRYPPQLEPPRGWCPTKKKDLKEGWPEGEEPRLRCTFCRRTYAGVNAKSMWRRHVYEKHKIAMSNRRDNQERKGRSYNKENKEGRAGDKSTRASVVGGGEEYRHQGTFLHPPDVPSLSHGSSASDHMGEDEVGTAAPVPTSSSVADSESDVFLVGTSSSTPPLTPGLSPTNPLTSRLRKQISVGESPYNPLLTPSFRHSPARPPSDQPWRFPSPSHPLHSDARELSLSMLMRAEASPIVSGLDVSPLVIVPASERRKRSIFSSPIVKVDSQEKEVCTDGEGGEKLAHVPKPSRKFDFESFLPTPLTDRVKFKQYRIPESPLGRNFVGREKSLVSVVKANDLWRSGGPLSPAKTPGRKTDLLEPIELEDSDTFVSMLYKSMSDAGDKLGTKRVLSPPTSSPETDSPVLRSSQLSRSETTSSTVLAPDGFGLGIGLMEGFSLKETMGDGKDKKYDSPFTLISRKQGDPFQTSDGSPIAVTGKMSYRQFLTVTSQDPAEDYEMQETSQPKKRRRTISGRG